MKLLKLQIKNFRGINGENNIINFDNSNIIFLVGQNNVGKSTFLRAYEFFVNAGQKAELEDFYNHDTNNQIEIIGEFLKEDEDENDDDLKKGTGKTTEPDWISKWVDSKSIVRVKKVWKTKGEIFEKQTFDPSNSIWVPNGFGGLHQKFQYYSPTPIYIGAMETEESLEEKVNKMINDDFFKKLEENHNQTYSDAVSAVKKLQQEILGTDVVKKYNTDINESFREAFADLTLEIKEKNQDIVNVTEAFKKNHSVKVKKTGSDREDSFIKYGHGVIRQALFNFLTFQKRKELPIRKNILFYLKSQKYFCTPK